jgi:DNA-binding HxlR family transcriptional regulator
MRKKEFSSQICSVARALEWVGEWWTLLIVREAFFGTRQFSDFERHLGVAKNVLTERLHKLVEAGIFERTAVRGRGNPQLYTLTEMGHDLLPVIISLMQWGDRWLNGPGRAPVRVVDRASRDEISPMLVRDRSGRALSLTDIQVVPGPGANDAIRRRFGGPPAEGETSDNPKSPPKTPRLRARSRATR